MDRYELLYVMITRFWYTHNMWTSQRLYENEHPRFHRAWPCAQIMLALICMNKRNYSAV